jgi:hypothetical protein
MELTLVDGSNPIHQWMERAGSTVELELDEESSETDAPIPSVMVTATADSWDLQRRTESQSVSQLARKNIGDSHKGEKKNICYEVEKAKHKTEGKISLMQLQRMKIVQPTKNLMIAV